MFNDSLIYFGIKHTVQRCSPCPQEICRLQKVRFMPASQVDIHTKLFNRIFILRWLHLGHRNLAILCLFLLKDYSLFDMHGTGDSSPTFPSEKDCCLLMMVLTTISLQRSASSGSSSATEGPYLRSHHSWGSPYPGIDLWGGCQNPVISTHWGTSLTDHMYFRALHVLGQSFVGLASKFDFSLCSVVLLEPSFPRFWF